ncbi:MAG: hypothetical protein F9K24_20770 [Leptonema illini]|uniref:Uncharacterized protein n=1 Tax=Leptonema illini TaxID=183 RepID=A0A833GXL2_9LEPT|nr:MAG: hypothetical protein F9K24_20770 [Leptonema illini]
MYEHYYEIGNGFRIGNPKGYIVNDTQKAILLEFCKHLTPEEMELFRITSTTRPKYVHGFHASGHAIDTACDTLHLMIKLYDGMIAAKWPGGIAVASFGLALHVHCDDRHNVRQKNGKLYPAYYFVEQLVGPESVIYPSKQSDPALYQKYYMQIRKFYGAKP